MSEPLRLQPSDQARSLGLGPVELIRLYFPELYAALPGDAVLRGDWWPPPPPLEVPESDAVALANNLLNLMLLYPEHVIAGIVLFAPRLPRIQPAWVEGVRLVLAGTGVGSQAVGTVLTALSIRAMLQQRAAETAGRPAQPRAQEPTPDADSESESEQPRRLVESDRVEPGTPGEAPARSPARRGRSPARQARSPARRGPPSRGAGYGRAAVDGLPTVQDVAAAGVKPAAPAPLDLAVAFHANGDVSVTVSKNEVFRVPARLVGMFVQADRVEEMLFIAANLAVPVDTDAHPWAAGGSRGALATPARRTPARRTPPAPPAAAGWLDWLSGPTCAARAAAGAYPQLVAGYPGSPRARAAQFCQADRYFLLAAALKVGLLLGGASCLLGPANVAAALSYAVTYVQGAAGSWLAVAAPSSGFLATARALTDNLLRARKAELATAALLQANPAFVAMASSLATVMANAVPDTVEIAHHIRTQLRAEADALLGPAAAPPKARPPRPAPLLPAPGGPPRVRVSPSARRTGGRMRRPQA